MKRFNLRYLLLAVLPIALLSCEDETLVVLNPTAAITPTLSDSEVILTKEGEGTDVLTVSWPEPDYGFAAAPAYVVHLDREGSETPAAISVAGDLQKVFKSEELNSQLINLGFEPEVPGELKVRVESKLGAKSIFSEVQTVTVTAYTAFLDLSTTWGIVGSGFNNWGAFPDAPFYTSGTANVLVAYVKLLDGDIKFRENNEWTLNYGDNGADGTLEQDGANIAVTAGHYKVTFNTSTKSYTIVPFTWGIVGSAYNDWGADGPDFPFYYDDATDQWRAIVKLLAGDFKIRKNNDWGTNYGDDGADGTLELDGDNMTVAAGKYEITFNEKDLTVEIKPIDHIWGLVGSSWNDWGAAGADAAFIKDYRNEGIWVLKNVTLLDGEYKFRDANDWATNYGDNGGNGSLELDGANIQSDAKVYTITLDFTDPANPQWEAVAY
jgi:starch-binding outer membrane protein SusE/F